MGLDSILEVEKPLEKLEEKIEELKRLNATGSVDLTEEIRLLEDKALAWKITGKARQECKKYQWDAVKSEWLKLYHEPGRQLRRPAHRAAVGREAPMTKLQ